MESEESCSGLKTTHIIKKCFSTSFQPGCPQARVQMSGWQLDPGYHRRSTFMLCGAGATRWGTNLQSPIDSQTLSLPLAPESPVGPSVTNWESLASKAYLLLLTSFLTHKSSVEHHPKVHEEDSTLSDIEPISRIMWQTFGFGNTQLPPKAILKGSKCKPHVACKIKGTCLWDRGLEDIYNTVQPHPSTVLSRALQTWLCVTQDTQ